MKEELYFKDEGEELYELLYEFILWALKKEMKKGEGYVSAYKRTK